MKTYKNLWNDFISEDNIKLASIFTYIRKDVKEEVKNDVNGNSVTYYENGLWSKGRPRVLVQKNILTEYECKSIINEDYQE